MQFISICSVAVWQLFTKDFDWLIDWSVCNVRGRLSGRLRRVSCERDWARRPDRLPGRRRNCCTVPDGKSCLPRWLLRTDCRLQICTDPASTSKRQHEVLPEPQRPYSGADLRSLSPKPNTSLHCETTDTKLVHRMVCLFTPQHTHCTYPQRDGQAELTWAAGYIPKWFTHLPTVTHPTTNRARRWLTSLMRPTTLPTKPDCHHSCKRRKIRRPSGAMLCSHPLYYTMHYTTLDLLTSLANWLQLAWKTFMWEPHIFTENGPVGFKSGPARLTNSDQVTPQNTHIYCIWQPGGWINIKHNINKNNIIIQGNYIW